MKRILFVNGQVVRDDQTSPADILVEDSLIAAVGHPGTMEGVDAERVDCRNCILIPGGIDPHVHLALPSPAGPTCDDFVTGSQAALFGGTTTLLDFVTPAQGESLPSALSGRIAEAQNCLADYSFHMGLTWWGPGIEEQIAACVQMGIQTFKVYLAYTDSIGITPDHLEKAMRVIGSLGGLVLVHAEDDEMVKATGSRLAREGNLAPRFHTVSRPPEAETSAVRTIIRLVEKTACPAYIVHVSTGAAAALIAQARGQGLPVMGETCPHYLLLDDRLLGPRETENLKYVFSPPLRPHENLNLLWEALQQGHLQTLATDHCPFHLHGQKDQGLKDFRQVPNGIGGIDLRLPLTYTHGVTTGRLSRATWTRILATNSARIFGLWGKKGLIREGWEADLVVWDPECHSQVNAINPYQVCDYSVFQGFHLTGQAKMVMRRGEMIVREGQVNPHAGKGMLLKRSLPGFS